VQKRGNFNVESVLIFDIGEVRGVKFNIARTWNLLCEKASVGGGRSRIVRSRNHKRRYANPAQLFAEIEIANGGATRRISLWVCFLEHFQST